jgi:putative transposase
MARGRRLIPRRSAMHIMCRGNNKQNIFHSESDKLKYYSLLAEHKQENKISIFHYCIMSNHVHLIVWLEEESRISKFMMKVNLSYFAYYKKIYDYCGHLWQGRFKSKIIEDDAYLLQCGKYIELNPVRKQLVRVPEEYPFSSYTHYACGRSDAIINNSPAYLAIDKSERKRRKEYTEFVIPDLDGDVPLHGDRSPHQQRPLRGERPLEVSAAK